MGSGSASPQDRGAPFAFGAAELSLSNAVDHMPPLPPAAAIDVPGMTCSEVGSFAQRVAQQKATGVALNQAVPRLRRSFRREHADTEHELEKIVRAIYEMPIFSTVSPEEIGRAYRTACEHD